MTALLASGGLFSLIGVIIASLVGFQKVKAEAGKTRMETESISFSMMRESLAEMRTDMERLHQEHESEREDNKALRQELTDHKYLVVELRTEMADLRAGLKVLVQLLESNEITIPPGIWTGSNWEKK